MAKETREIYKEQLARAGWANVPDLVLDRLAMVDYADGYHRDGEYEFILMNENLSMYHCIAIEKLGQDFSDMTVEGWVLMATFLKCNPGIDLDILVNYYKENSWRYMPCLESEG